MPFPLRMYRNVLLELSQKQAKCESLKLIVHSRIRISFNGVRVPTASNLTLSQIQIVTLKCAKFYLHIHPNGFCFSHFHLEAYSHLLFSMTAHVFPNNFSAQTSVYDGQKKASFFNKFLADLMNTFFTALSRSPISFILI